MRPYSAKLAALKDITEELSELRKQETQRHAEFNHACISDNWIATQQYVAMKLEEVLINRR